MEWPLSKSLKDINKKKNFDLKNINHWLRANKISLNNDSLQIKKKKNTNQKTYELSNKWTEKKYCQITQIFRFTARLTPDIQTKHWYNQSKANSFLAKTRMFYLTGSSTNFCSFALTFLLTVAFWFPILISIIYDSSKIVQF